MDLSDNTSIDATKAQTITVGEVRALFAALPDDTPILTYGAFFDDDGRSEDYINLTSVSLQGYAEGHVIVTLDQGDMTDNRGW
jgi:hypothetical protein